MNSLKILQDMDPGATVVSLVKFIKDELTRTPYRKLIVGVSGGVDSAVVAWLANTAIHDLNSYSIDNNNQLYGIELYYLPSQVDAEDEFGHEFPPETTSKDRAKMVAEYLGQTLHVLDLSPVTARWRHMFEMATDEKMSKFDYGNLISRTRANALSTIAALSGGLIVGTGNRDEDYGIGYYTLFGDGAVHMSPLGGLHKRHVRDLAHYLGYPAEISAAVASAGLEPGQTDLKDLGYSYNAVEWVICCHDQGLHTPWKDDYFIHNVSTEKFESPKAAYDDIMRRHKIALAKMRIVSPPVGKPVFTEE